MNRIRKYTPLGVALLVVSAMLAATNPAQASFQIRYSNNGGPFSVAVSDGGVGDNNPAAGAISVNVAGFNITASTSGGTSTPVTVLDVQIQSIGLGPTVAGSIVVQASMDTLLTGPPPQTLVNRFSDATIPPNVSATARTWIDQGNGLFVTSGGGIVLDTGNLLPTAPLTTTHTFSANVPYSITSQINASYLAGASLSLDSNDRIQPVPAPAGIVLALTGVPFGLGAWLRLRRNRLKV